MLRTHLGETAALLTAICWSFTSISFESACKRVGALAVNFLRLSLAFLFLGILLTVSQGHFLPFKVSGHAWFWLSLSGIIGFVLGDYCLFQAYVEVGARVAMLIMALVPPITAIIGWFFLGETLTAVQIIAMIMTISGIASVVLEKKANENHLSFAKPVKGILLALGGAVGQAVGLIFSKYGMGGYNAFAATQIRVIAGIFGFGLILLLQKRGALLRIALHDKIALQRIGLGAFFGPFLGVSLSLYAVQHTVAGVASTIMAIVPVLIIPFSIILLKEKVTLKEILGAFLAVGGVTLYFF